MVTNSKSWQRWHEEHGCKFGQFIHVREAEALRDAAPLSLQSASLNRDALAVGRYMRRWQETGGAIPDDAPRVPGDTYRDPAIEYSKIVGFLSA